MFLNESLCSTVCLLVKGFLKFQLSNEKYRTGMDNLYAQVLGVRHIMFIVLTYDILL